MNCDDVSTWSQIKSFMSDIPLGSSRVIPCGVGDSRRIARYASVLARQGGIGGFSVCNVADTDSAGIRVWRTRVTA